MFATTTVAAIVDRVSAVVAAAVDRASDIANRIAERISTTTIVVAVGLLALIVIARLLHLWHAGVHAEYAGPGRVRFLSFFRGAGYCIVLVRGRGRDGRPIDAPGWRPNITLPGFTLYLRTARSARPPYPGRGTPVGRFRITTNGNLPVV